MTVGIQPGDHTAEQRQGRGSLYHRHGTQVAYEGAWSKGRMHGYGCLYDADGALVWQGEI